MDKILNIGKWLFPLSFIMYIGLHLGKPEVGADLVPNYFPIPLFWNYITALFITAFIISALLKKYDKLAYSLMALYVFLMGILIHLPRSFGYDLSNELMGGDVAKTQELEMVNFFRNIMVGAALLGFARYVAKDSRIVGS